MTLKQNFQNINSTYKREMILDGIVNLEDLMNSIVIDAKEGKSRVTARESNLGLEIVKQIENRFDLTFVPEKENGNLCFVNNNDELRDEFVQSFSPIDVLDYLYAVLHSTKSKNVHQAFLEMDFSKISYPKTISGFRSLTVLGRKLRQIHLLESSKVNLAETVRLTKAIDAVDIIDCETKL
ncbi:type ISP restriction/modification enzyme [Flavobacterium granuli]|uniref:Type ISP restriction-modification enzyme LLaBIII C-terminal specificity domain-containing protein n=1 Tax=Flavobacterium granuli TaxID=280093 RepID=A0A1M5PRS9_9FLAO|nr:type ISP restriction/modification enzyme [Flavobacterium granuli]PRZ26587.1 hypothetical protein BC624_102566 [Flavobacterium granuli]SHH04229.1 hypothetical protein SAMN05443373_106163 [Flavobacterium granuli]